MSELTQPPERTADSVERRQSRIRFSLRFVFVTLFLFAILCGMFAYHFRRLNRQSAAVDFFKGKRAKVSDGHVEMAEFVFGSRIVPPVEAAEVTISLPTVTARELPTWSTATGTEWLLRREQVLQLPHDVPFDRQELVGRLRDLPWLEHLIVEVRLVPFIDADSQPCYRTEQAVSDQDLEMLQIQFPVLEITKTANVNNGLTVELKDD